MITANASAHQELTQQHAPRWHECLALTHRLNQQHSEARAAYEAALERDPSNLDRQRRFAHWLAESTAAQDHQRAVEVWRQITAASEKYSDQWWEGKFEAARLLAQQGQRTRARQAIELLEILRPDLGGEAWKPRFLELKRNLGDAR